MLDRHTISSAEPARQGQIVSILKEVVNELTGVDISEIDANATFFQLGVDSLLLIQGSRAIQDRLGIDIPFRLLFEELSTLNALAAHVDQKLLPPDLAAPGALQRSTPEVSQAKASNSQLPSPGPVSGRLEPEQTSIHSPAQGFRYPSVASRNGNNTDSPAGHGDASVMRAPVEQIIEQQLRLMSEQLKLLNNDYSVSEAEAEANHYEEQPPDFSVAVARPEAAAEVQIQSAEPVPAKPGPEPFVPFQPIHIESSDGLNDRQQRYLDSFIARYAERTGESKRQTQAHRQLLADGRVSVGFRLRWKELIYPIIADRSSGSKFWDVDGNEYVDLTMGFGVNLFGHSPRFITEALQERLERGIQLGPQSNLTGKVAELVSELTGAQRVAFMNSGTEAVMAALRVARTVTRRDKIALFSGSYHGTFDGVLARALDVNGRRQAVAVAPGVPPGMVKDVMILDYARPETLEVLKAHIGELGAVLVEPVQSRQPDLQPQAFLQEMRQLTERAGVPLIFDEVITGFRIHPGGAQGWFGVQADLVTYGKVLGGGLPIGVLAGKADYMDAIDGGMWNFGDESYPRAHQTLVTGTFCKHPLTMAAAYAVLNHLKDQGAGLQQRLNQRTSELAATLNAYFDDEQVPIRITNFGSLFRFVFPQELRLFKNLFFYHLVNNGVYVWEGDTRFISTAHTSEDIEYVIASVKKSVSQMRDGGFLPEPLAGRSKKESPSYQLGQAPALPASPTAKLRDEPATASSNGHEAAEPTAKLPRLPLTEMQKQVWILTQLGDEVSIVYNESQTMHLRGRFDAAAMREALNEVIKRHEALRITISPEGDYQQVHPAMALDVPLVDFSHLADSEREAQAAEWTNREARQPFDIVRGPLIRGKIAKLEEQYHLLVLTIHHIIIDGRSHGVLLHDLSAIYSAKCQRKPVQLPPPASFSKYARQAAQRPDEDMSAAETYWTEQLGDSFPYLELSTVRPRPLAQTYSVARESLRIGQPLYDNLKDLSAQQNSTLFVTLLAGFYVLLNRVSGQDDLVTSANAVEQSSTKSRSLIGYRINPLPLRSRLSASQPFTEYLTSVRRLVLDGYEHQNVSFPKLMKKLNMRRDPTRPPVSTVFNLDHSGAGPQLFGLEVEMDKNPTGSKLDMFWNIRATDGELLVDCEYNPDLFDAQSVQSWIRHFQAILQGIATNPSQPISDLPQLLRRGEAAIETTQTRKEEFNKAYEDSNLTKYQMLLWAAQKMEPESTMLNLSIIVNVPARIYPGPLQQAFQTVINSSDALRTVIREVDGLPHQEVLDRIDYKLEYVDLSQESDPHAAARAWLDARIRVALDLQARLFDSALVKVADEECIWFYNQHHILNDGWSMGVVASHLFKQYEDALEGRLQETIELPLYSDYVEHERKARGTPRYLQAEAYWKERLAEETEPIAFYGKLSTKRSSRMQRVSCDFGDERIEKLKALAMRRDIFLMSLDTSLFNIFTALVYTLLHRLSGTRRISVGVPFHNRRTKQFKETIGLFMQYLPYRIDIEEGETFLSLIKKVTAETVTSLRYSDYPIGNPIHKQAFEVESNYVVAPSLEYRNKPVKVEWFHSGYGDESLGLQLHNFGRGDSFGLDFDFHCDVFDEQERQNLIRHFFNMVDAILENPAQPVSLVSLLSDGERQHILEEFNRTETAFPTDRTVIQLFEAQVKRTPDRFAVACEGQALTYERLNARANRMAHNLRPWGVGEEVLVAILADRGIDFLVSILAIFKAGMAYLPLDPAHPASRHLQILTRSKSPLVIASDEHLSNISEALEDLPLQDRPAVVSLESLLNIDGPEHDLELAYRPNSLSYTLFTSGSTGMPKGAMIEQAGMHNHIFAKISDLKLNDSDVIAQNASQCFDISVWQFLTALLVGGRVHIFGDEVAYDGPRLLEEAANAGITILEIVPSQLQAMLASIALPGASQPDLSRLRILFVTGEALPPALCRQWIDLYPGTLLVNGYGPTETSDDVTHYHITEPPPSDAQQVPIGRALSNTLIYVLDEKLSPTPIGMAGELYVGGICVGRGYLNDPDRTAQSFVPNPFSAQPGERLYRTGDLTRYLPDGNIEFLGRIDHQVKIRGFRIELGEIEAALSSFPGVEQALVVARRDPPHHDRLVAYLVASNDAIGSAQLRDFLKQKLPDYMMPSWFMMLDSLPLSPNGKVDRKALPEPDHLRPDLETKFEASRNPAEETLVSIWSQVLGIDQIGVNDNFFGLGGDSILSIQVASKSTQAGIRITPLQMFQHQTIAELAAVASTRPVAGNEQELVKGEAPLTPIQHWFFELNVPDPHYWNQAAIFEARQALDPALLRKTIEKLIEHHDALRLRFHRTDSGWRQVGADAGEAVPLSQIDFSHLSQHEQATAIMAEAERLQASLNLEEGPLLRVALFDLGAHTSGRLLIIIHHLAVDAVSWRILLEDLDTVYQQLSQARDVQLPPKTTSFKYWAERLTEHAQSQEMLKELDYWLAEPRRRVRRLPVDFEGSNTKASAQTISVEIDARETEALLRDVPRVYGAQINDVLLTALAQAFERWTGESSVLINMESHGREEIVEDLDLSRTVGWFTAIIPLLLSVEHARTPEAALTMVKEQLQGLPNRGIGYGLLRYLKQDAEIAQRFRALPKAEVGFNYLGQMDQIMPSSAPLALAQDKIGPVSSPQGDRLYLLDVTALVNGGRLHLSWAYSANLHRSSTIEALVQYYRDALRALIDGCKPSESMNLTPSVFNWSQADLEEITAAVMESKQK